MPSNVKVSASWKTVSALYTRVGGSWKNVSEGYTKIGGAWKSFFTSNALVVEYLVIAGGGGGGSDQGGGGGAGGYLTASGLSLTVGTSYTVTVGAGGAGSPANSAGGASGSNSVFSSFTSTGGGRGGNGNADTAQTGGSGGGGGAQTSSQSGKAGTSGQGFAGGNGSAPNAGGGGGASEAGNTDGQREGGDGVSSSITGSAVTRAGGGAGASNNGTNITGGSGGGGTATGNNTSGTAGTVNTGSGGGGGGSTAGVGNGAGGAGGSGIVIIKYPDTFAINPSPGLSHRTVTSAGFNITTFTAGTGTVSFAAATTSSYELIQTVYLTASTSSVTFDVSGLGSTYQHLQLRVTARSSRADVGDDIILRFNNDSTVGNYRYHALYGTGSVAGSENAQVATGARFMQATGANFTASAFNAGVCDILDPFETTKNKTIRTLSGVPGSYDRIWLASNLWVNTSAVTSITLVSGFSANFVTGSRFSIYGLKGS